MSLTVKHLNCDSSFLLTFQPIVPFPPSPGESKSFTILVDPWISGPSKIFHPKFSISRQKTPPCVSHLSELPEPDLVIISQDKTDHCHRETLTQLPRREGKTLVLAEPASAKTIRSWKHFDPSKVATLPRWKEPRPQKPSAIHRIPLPSLSPGGTPGEVTIAYIPQRPDLTGLHSAIGITYRPPTTTSPFEIRPLTPPDTPKSSTFSTAMAERTLSVIYAPHGCNYKTLTPYITSHLINEAALPLTALLHCFDKVQSAWWLGGNICSGFPGGREIAENLCARAWISAHDGDKELKGFASSKLVVEKYEREDVESVISPRSEKFPNRRIGTEAVVLDVGEEIHLNSAMDFGPGYDDDSEHERFTNIADVC